MKGDVAMPLRRTDDNSLHWPLRRTDDNSLLDCDVVVIDDFSQRRRLPGQPVGNGPGLPRVVEVPEPNLRGDVVEPNLTMITLNTLSV